MKKIENKYLFRLKYKSNYCVEDYKTYTNTHTHGQ